MSTGQQFTEIPLGEKQSTLIIGSNGAGKSTMLDALCFALFNKPFRKISRSQLINSINEKELRVEVEFVVGTIKYKVIRGVKPNVFQIFRNDELLDQDAAVKDTQKYLEQSVLKLNYKSFTQVVILGSSTFVPFMQLTAPNRREVIEDILDIQIFSFMNGLLKERIKDIRDEKNQCEYELEIAQQKVEMQRKNIENLEQVDQRTTGTMMKKFDDNEKRVAEIKKEIKEKEKEIDKITPQVLELDKAVQKHEQLKVMKTKLNVKKKASNKDVDFFQKNDTCPVCTQNIGAELKESKVTSLKQKVDELNIAHSQIAEHITSMSTEVENLRAKAAVINSHRYEIQSLTKEEMRILKENTRLMTEVGSEATNLEA